MQTSKFRSFKTSSGKLVLFGKSSSSNEDLMKIKKPNDFVLHTNDPGSPFCIISKDADKKDLKEVAIICTSFSQQWKKKRRTAKASVFKGKNVYKERGAKIGTFHVKKQEKTIKVKLELFIGFQDSQIKAVPKSCLIKPLIKLTPGNIKKEKAAKIIKEILEKKHKIKVKQEKIMQIIPAEGFNIRG